MSGDSNVVQHVLAGAGAASYSRRSLLKGASSLALLRFSLTSAHAQARGELLLGLSQPTYYGGFSPFLNWWKQAGPLQLTFKDGRTLAGREAWEAGNYLKRETGELNTPVSSDLTSFSRIFFTNAHPFQKQIGCDYSGEEFCVTWEGEANVRIDFLTVGAVIRRPGRNQVIFKMGSNPGNTSVTFDVTDVNNPPRAIKLYQMRYARNVLNGELYNPDWIAAVGEFGTLRCMDWQATNNSTITDFSQLADYEYCSWGQSYTSSSPVDEHGPKGAIHPQILCELANLTGANLHVCIPHRATNQFIASFASYFRDHTTVQVTYELSNECWNGAFMQFEDFVQQGNKLWPDDSLRGSRYYGYRAAECMSIVAAIYEDQSRWRGALATQTVNTAVTKAILGGAEQWIFDKTSRAQSVSVSSLFKGLYVTGYFGDVISCSQPQSITRSTSPVITSEFHGFETGAQVRFFIASGMTQLNGRDALVRKIDDNRYTIDVDTTGFEPYVSGVGNYVAPAAFFKLIDESKTRHQRNPELFRDPYLYFNQQLSLSLLEGKCPAGFSTQVSVAALRKTYWPAQLALADAYNLVLQQYEGGCHLVGDAYLTGYGGNADYTEYLLHHGHSLEVTHVYEEMYKGFRKAGGQLAAKYLADGTVSQFGSWAGVRYWPTLANRSSNDCGNPVWQATIAANRSRPK